MKLLLLVEGFATVNWYSLYVATLCAYMQLYCTHNSNTFSVAACNRDLFVPWDSSYRMKFYSAEVSETPATDSSMPTGHMLLRDCGLQEKTSLGKTNST